MATMTLGVQEVLLRDITIDPTIQPRTETDLRRVREFAQAMRDGSVFPPVILFKDGDTLLLSDGFHRVAGAQGAGQVAISAEVRGGSRHDATLWAIQGNAHHGVPLDRYEKRCAITWLLAEHTDWSDRQIAALVGASPTTVGTVRSELERCVQIGHTDTRQDAHGHARPASQPPRTTSHRDEFSQDAPQDSSHSAYTDEGWICADCGRTWPASQTAACPDCEPSAEDDDAATDTTAPAMPPPTAIQPAPSSPAAPATEPFVLPPKELSKEQKAFHTIGNLFHLVHLNPAEVAATPGGDTLDIMTKEVGDLSRWLVAVHKALEARRERPTLTAVK